MHFRQLVLRALVISFKFAQSLCLAALYGQERVCEILLDYGVDPTVSDSEGNLPLCEAVRAGQTNIFHTLLRYGADPNEADPCNKCTPLHYAANGNHRELCILLLKLGVDVSAVDTEHMTASHYALQEKHFEVHKIIEAVEVCEGIKDDHDGKKDEMMKMLVDLGVWEFRSCKM